MTAVGVAQMHATCQLYGKPLPAAVAKGAA